MAEYLTNTADMTIVADAIRAKGGTSAPLEFPQGMADAVAAISGENGEVVSSIWDRSITGEYRNDVCTIIKAPNILEGCKNLTSVLLPNLTTIDTEGVKLFGGTKITELNLPRLSTIKSSSTIIYAGELVKIVLPSLTEIYGTGNMGQNPKLKIADFGTNAVQQAGILPRFLFSNDTMLDTVILRNAALWIIKYPAKNVFDNTPIANGTGYVYVPKALMERYKSATNWVAIASQIRAIEDYPEITGGVK